VFAFLGQGCNVVPNDVLYITVHFLSNSGHALAIMRRESPLRMPMRGIAVTTQILIGITLLWLGLHKLLHLFASAPLRCMAQQSIATIFLSRYFALLFGIEVLGGLLLLLGRWKVLAFVLLGPIALNIVFFHLFMGRDSTVFAVAFALLESLLIWSCRRFFRSSSMFEGQVGPLQSFHQEASCSRLGPGEFK